MPEGVEIRIQVNNLKPICVGSKIVEIKWNKSFQKNGIKNFKVVKLPLIVTDVWSRGKVIVFQTVDTTNKILYITSQLGMSGHWVRSPQKHSNLWFRFGVPHTERPGFWKITHTIWYNDQRHFGGIGFYRDLSEIWKRHGPCLMTTVLVNKGLLKADKLNTYQKLVSLKYYISQIRNKRFRSKRIAEFMMEQQRVSGVGNYLRAEILYQARISPFRLLTDLSDQDIKNLYEASLDIMYRSYASKCGYHVGKDCGSGFKKLVYKKDKDPNGYDVCTTADKNKRMCYYVTEIQK